MFAGVLAPRQLSWPPIEAKVASGGCGSTFTANKECGVTATEAVWRPSNGFSRDTPGEVTPVALGVGMGTGRSSLLVVEKGNKGYGIDCVEKLSYLSNVFGFMFVITRS